MDISEFIKANSIKAAVFDMDGTLTDSMKRWNEIYRILFDCFGLDVPCEFMMRFNHIPMQRRVNVIAEELSLNVNVQAVYEHWLEGAIAYYKNVFKIKQYMLEMLKILNGYGIKMAIATASDRCCAQAFMESNGLQEYISFITSLDEAERPKSFPDIYFKAAEKLGVRSCECLVFEDALTAIRGAKSGGFRVCGVQDDCSASDEEKIKGISDITLGF